MEGTMNFSKWFYEQGSTIGTENVDESQINSAYKNTKYSVRLVRLYDKLTNQSLLKNISTIALLQSGAYGLYSSSENKKIIGPSVINKLKMKFGSDILMTQKLNSVPNAVIKKYIPDIDVNQLQPSDVIRVNVQKHLATHGDTLEAVLEIASTIVHECTHELELQNYGQTSEVGPTQAEKRFMDWVSKNWIIIRQNIPELASLRRKT
jgi:hypothetical protein